MKKIDIQQAAAIAIPITQKYEQIVSSYEIRLKVAESLLKEWMEAEESFCETKGLRKSNLYRRTKAFL